MSKFWSKSPRKQPSVKTKGLDNEPGENNCFLNSAVQVLWHLDVFRKNFSLLTGHHCFNEDSCIFCSLKTLFAGFKYSDKKTIPPTDLRMALASIYQDQNRFQLGLMDDAAECFENLLIQIHKHLVGPANSDSCVEKHCLPHQKFGMTLIEQGVCACGEMTEPSSFTQLVHYVSATALSARLKDRQRHFRATDPDRSFGRLIRAVGSLGGARKCPTNCGSDLFTKTTLMNAPDVISIGINWDTNEPSMKHIGDLIETLNITIRLQDMFDIVLDRNAQRTEYHLSTLVCYYGRHYTAFFYKRKQGRWVSIDDSTVSDAGKNWNEIAHKFVKGHSQPLLLLYTSYNPEPLPIATAPPSIIRQCPSVQSSPALSQRSRESYPQASSSSDEAASPSHSMNGHASVRKKLTWASAAPTKRIGQYKEPKSSSFTVYKAYPVAQSNSTKQSDLSKLSTDSARGSS